MPKGRSRAYYGLPRKVKGSPSSSRGKEKVSTRKAPVLGGKTYRKLKSQAVSKWVTIAPKLHSFYRDLMKQKKITTSDYRIRLRRNK